MPDSSPDAALRRRVARLRACQALFQLEARATAGKVFEDVSYIVSEFCTHRFSEPCPGFGQVRGDIKFFMDLLSGIADTHQEMDRKISSCFSAQENLRHMEPMLRCVLRLGVFELVHRSEIPARVIVNEYLLLGDAFLGPPQVSAVNAVLDRLAKEQRGPEVFRQKLPAETS